MRLIFMGTPDFAVPVLEALHKEGHEIGYVITQPDRAGNRGKVTYTPVKEKALELGIEVLQPDDVNSSDVLGIISGYSPDAAVVVAYGQILRRDLLDIPKFGMFNVHASLLPKLRGASPIQHAILDGEEETGVTIMKIDEGLDSGDMLMKGATPVDGKNFETLHDELSAMGAELICKALKLVEDGSVRPEKQDDSLATYAGMIKKEDGKLDFSESAAALERKIRAFDPWPGAFCELYGKTVRVWSAELIKQDADSVPGTIEKADKEGLAVSCGDGKLLIKEIQLPGKKRVSVRDFLLGHRIEPGTVLNSQDS